MEKTVVKAFKVLEVLAASAEPQGISSLSSVLGLGKSNVHRLLATLVGLGYVRSLEGGRYEATLRLWEHGTHVLTRNDAKHTASPFLPELVKATGETAFLSVLEGFDIVYVDKLESERHAVRAFSRIGARAPAYAVATGKALLAFQPPEVIESFQENLVSYTPKTILSTRALLSELAKVRVEGVAFNSGEWRDGVCGVAAPIRANDGCVVMAVGISGPADRFRQKRLKELAPIVAEVGRHISEALGYRGK